ncbi:hypothetical protein D3C77_289750 [compost metagenome]
MQADIGRLRMGEIDAQRGELVTGDLAQRDIEPSHCKLGVLSAAGDTRVGQLIVDFHPSTVQIPGEFIGMGMHHQIAADEVQHRADIDGATCGMPECTEITARWRRTQLPENYAHAQAGIDMLGGRFQQLNVASQRHFAICSIDHIPTQADGFEVRPEDLAMSLQQCLAEYRVVALRHDGPLAQVAWVHAPLHPNQRFASPPDKGGAAARPYRPESATSGRPLLAILASNDR